MDATLFTYTLIHNAVTPHTEPVVLWRLYAHNLYILWISRTHQHDTRHAAALCAPMWLSVSTNPAAGDPICAFPGSSIFINYAGVYSRNQVDKENHHYYCLEYLMSCWQQVLRVMVSVGQFSEADSGWCFGSASDLQIDS